MAAATLLAACGSSNGGSSVAAGGTAGAAGATSGGTGGIAAGGASGANGGGGGGAGGTGAEAGMGGAAGCQGVDLEQDGVLDLDLKAIRVHGVVTLNGAPLPDADAGRGQLQFRSAVSGDSAKLSLGAAGPASYDVTLPPGSYDVVFSGDAALCDAASTPAMPCNTGVLRKAVTLNTDGVLDLDVPAATVQGKVTVNGAPMPSASLPRGHIEFVDAKGNAVQSRSFGASGSAAYAMMLLPGTYDVVWDGNSSGCGQAGGVPCNRGVVKADVAISRSGVLDLDVPAATVRGSVSVNHLPMPSAGGDRGRLGFVGASGDRVETQSFGSSGAAAYAITLISGTYDVTWKGNAALCNRGAPGVPCNDGTLKQAAALTQSGVLDVDVPAVQVQGKVTVNGAPMPSAPVHRGALSFSRGRTEFETPDFGATGLANYAVTLLSGSYDVSWHGNPSLCDQGAGPGVPCNEAIVEHAVRLSANGVLDVEVPAARVQGEVTINRAVMPDAPAVRGSLGFSASGNDKIDPFVTSSFGATGPASYDATLVAGSYDVQWLGNHDLCRAADPSSVPCNDAVIKSGVSLGADGVLDLDVPSVKLRGQVTLNGAPLPDASADRGTLRFIRVGGGPVDGRALGSTGAGSYAVTLVAGRYVVAHEANSALCDGTNSPSVPCAGQLLVGCD